MEILKSKIVQFGNNLDFLEFMNGILNREEARKRVEVEAEVKHADKLIQGFEKLEESHAKSNMRTFPKCD